MRPRFPRTLREIALLIGTDQTYPHLLKNQARSWHSSRKKNVFGIPLEAMRAKKPSHG